MQLFLMLRVCVLYMIKKVINVVVLLAIAGGSSVCFSSDALDAREKIFLNEAERHHVLSEMRLFLSSIQQIIQGVSEDDLKLVVEYAKKAGRAGSRGAPPTLGAKLPEGFRLLGSQTHAKFDRLAMDVADLEDGSHAISQLSSLMKNCIACHATYRIELSGAR